MVNFVYTVLLSLHIEGHDVVRYSVMIFLSTSNGNIRESLSFLIKFSVAALADC